MTSVQLCVWRWKDTIQLKQPEILCSDVVETSQDRLEPLRK